MILLLSRLFVLKGRWLRWRCWKLVLVCVWLDSLLIGFIWLSLCCWCWVKCWYICWLECCCCVWVFLWVCGVVGCCVGWYGVGLVLVGVWCWFLLFGFGVMVFLRRWCGLWLVMFWFFFIFWWFLVILCCFSRLCCVCWCVCWGSGFVLWGVWCLVIILEFCWLWLWCFRVGVWVLVCIMVRWFCWGLCWLVGWWCWFGVCCGFVILCLVCLNGCGVFWLSGGWFCLNGSCYCDLFVLYFEWIKVERCCLYICICNVVCECDLCKVVLVCFGDIDVVYGVFGC